MNSLSGTKLGPYWIGSLIGAGGFAEVYQATKENSREIVAVKVFSPMRLHETHEQFEEFRRRFFRDFKILKSLFHAHMVKVYEYGEIDDINFMTMEYMINGSLKSKSRLKMPVPDACILLQKVADALDYIHYKNVIHRDVTPGNILFDAENEPRVTDFGIAKISDESTRLTGSGMMGTPGYAAPEQIDSARDVDKRADIYSLGIIFYEILTGQSPFASAKKPYEKLKLQMSGDIPELEIPGTDQRLVADLNDVIKKATQINLDQRYQSMQDFALDVAGTIDNHSTAFSEGNNIHNEVNSSNDSSTSESKYKFGDITVDNMSVGDGTTMNVNPSRDPQNPTDANS